MSRIVTERVTVRVPATSANLGAGFDCMGLALGIYDDVTLLATTSTSTEVTVEGEGAGRVSTDENNLVVKAIRLGLEMAGAPQVGIKLHCVNRVPHGRGMGSSAAAAVAGLVLAREMIDAPELLDNDTILTLATELEGHPDNAAPALLGGATVAWTDEKPHALRYQVSPELKVSVAVPEEHLSTAKARAALPENIPHADAVFNVSRAALGVLALQSRPDLLFAATDDRLHQPYRSKVMPKTWTLVEALREQQIPAAISGAGPSVIIFETLSAPVRQAVEEVGWKIIEPGVCPRGAHPLPPATDSEN